MTDIMTRLGKQPGDEISYDDAETLRALLTGQKIVDITETTDKALHDAQPNPESYFYGNREPYDKVIEYHLAGGVTLRAHAHDGGCGCSNGCFGVDIPAEAREKLIGATIMNVTTKEVASSWGDETIERIDGVGKSLRDGEATIEVFVYTDLGDKLPLVESSGGDNGYYGWGFHFSIAHPVLVVQETGERAAIAGEETAL